MRAMASCGTAALRNQSGRLPATDLRPLTRLARAETSATRKGPCMLAASDARWRVRGAGLLGGGPGCWAAGSLLLPTAVLSANSATLLIGAPATATSTQACLTDTLQCIQACTVCLGWPTTSYTP